MAHDDDVRVLVLQSADPDFFIAHGDVATILTMPVAEEPVRPSDTPGIHGVIDKLRTIPKVTIAKIEGFTRGGAGSEVSLACDMRFAALGKAVCSDSRRWGSGIPPGAGGVVRLVKLVGRARASEIVFGGDDFSAVEAERIGWINRALPPDELGPCVDALARRIARFPLHAIADIKQVMLACEADTLELFKDEQHAFERSLGQPGDARADAALPRSRDADTRRRAFDRPGSAVARRRLIRQPSAPGARGWAGSIGCLLNSTFQACHVFQCSVR